MGTLDIDRVMCDVCGRPSLYTCTVCLGDFCSKHQGHGTGHVTDDAESKTL